MGVMEVTENGLLLKEIAKDITVEQIQEATEATLIIDKNLKVMEA
jgi:acetate CoA/acetoacetate CoA-transferase beta subunit